jgi:hypothetical protein
MAALVNRRHEAFARARAAGAGDFEAYVKAGYEKSSRHWTRIAARADVNARTAEIAQENQWGGSRSLGPVINEMMRLAALCGQKDTPAAMAQARAFLVEAARLKELLPHEPAGPVERELTPAEWTERHGGGRY